ncbi:MAG: hypothetical protein QOJ01_1940 [Solirubrobacterales bacterium]|nr:hypothetical protein [Solirubrobacterales bacterium]
MTAFVTGGSGFIGGKLIARLVAEGQRVRALARSDASAARVAELGAEPVRGEIPDDIMRLVERELDLEESRLEIDAARDGLRGPAGDG